MINYYKKNRFKISLEQTLDLWYMARHERSNYIRQCWRTGRLSELIQTLIYPFRYLAYRWYRDIVSPKQVRYKLLFHIPESLIFSSEIPELFSDGHNGPCIWADEQRLLLDVDRQLSGIFRLAGGAEFPIDKLFRGEIEDVEHLHAYHRLYWAVRYARAVFCGHGDAFSVLKQDLSSWISQPWEGDIAVATPYTISERIASLAEVLFWLRQSNLSGIADMVISIKKRIYLDAIHLYDNLEIRDNFNNHILNNARALYIASRILHDIQWAEIWKKKAFELWDKYFPELILEDGSFAEQTSFYHLQMCRTALEYVLASRQSRRDVAPELFQHICKMFQQANDLIRSDGSLIRSGNISPDHIVEDFWGLLSACRAHGLLSYGPRHAVITLLTLYYSKVVKDSQTKKGEGKNITLYPEGGWAFITDMNLSMDMAIHGDPRKKTYHAGDAGRGTFELWWKDRVLLREPGNPTYTLKTRHWYRNGTGQNVSSLNGISSGISSEYQRNLPLWYFATQEGEWSQFGERGVMYVSSGLRRLNASIMLTRTWEWRDEMKLVMEETISGYGDYQFASNLHLGDAPWKQDSASNLVCLVDDAKVLMKITPPQNTKIKMMPSKYSPEYGVEMEGRTLSIVGKVKLPLKWLVEWEFYP